jgi:murein DD-endopeptidase MepM/ murein hydrolase activator NlpD
MVYIPTLARESDCRFRVPVGSPRSGVGREQRFAAGPSALGPDDSGNRCRADRRQPLLAAHYVRVISKHYTIVVENKATGVVRRFDVNLRPVLAAACTLFMLPVLFAAGVRWSASAELQALRETARASQVENASYRAATAELAGQITALQETVADLGKQSTIDPKAAKALAKLPLLMRNRAVGGVDGATLRSALSPAFTGPEDTFGILRDLLGRLESRLQLARPDIERRSALANATPSIWPAHGWLSATFGQRDDPFTGGPEFHAGIDISTDKGRPVFATGSGTVESASYSGAYGNLIVIDHGFGLVSRYGHLSAFAVKPGDQVSQGDVIGYVGATGRATGPHLHYEILVNGRPINPMQLIAGPR